MFSKKHRLSKTKDIQMTFSRGRSFFYPLFGIKFASHSNPPRFTVVVSTKVSKKAVVRNKIKRIIREILKTNINNLKNGDYMILVRPPMQKAENSEIRENVLTGLKKAKLL